MKEKRGKKHARGRMLTFLFHYMTMHLSVYGNDALPARLHEYIAYPIAPMYCRLPEGIAI